MKHLHRPLLVLLAVTLIGCGAEEQPWEVPDAPAQISDWDYTITPSGLKHHDLKVGSGPSPQKGQNVEVHYTGWLTNGKMFDSSVAKGRTFTFELGVGGVIKGWDEGVATMQVGGVRQLVIPPDLGYGSSAIGTVIPANSTLVFQVELLEIR